MGSRPSGRGSQPHGRRRGQCVYPQRALTELCFDVMKGMVVVALAVVMFGAPARADDAPISPARAAILAAAAQLVEDWKSQPDKAAYRRLMFDEGADWGVPLSSSEHGKVVKKTWGSHFGYVRNWCTAFARTAYRRAFAAIGTPLPIDLCPATATVPECKKLIGTNLELNNQSQAEVSTLREAFEHAGLAVGQQRGTPVVPGRGDMVFLDGAKYKRGHVALVECVERSDGPR